MIDTPQIVQTTDQLTATLHLVVPTTAIQTVMGPAIGEVMAAVAAQGLTQAGPWSTHHFHRPTDTFDFEICVPVSAPLTAVGRVKPGLWPAMMVARTIHRGGYDGLASAWGAFHTWMADNGYTPAGDLWERYLLGPESSDNPDDWRTELNQPVLV